MQSVLRQSAPWRRDIAWWIVLLEGILTLGIGIYIVFWLQQALHTALFVTGGYLVVTSVLHIGINVRRTSSIMTQFAIVRGIIGFVIGLLVIVELLLSPINAHDARIILAIGFLISGLIGLYGSFLGRKEVGHRLENLLSSLFNVVLAVLLFYFTATSIVILTWMGYIALIFGILLIIYAILLLYNAIKSKRTPAAASS